MANRPAQARSNSVTEDWRKPLGSEKSRTYLNAVRSLETAYAMFSVNLDEAFGMRRCGRMANAYQVLGVSPALCHRLASPLHSLLCAMLDHAKHFGTTPNLVPLDPENFQSTKSQRAARLSELFGKILLTRKSQFLHKITALSDLVQELNASFESTIEKLGEQHSLRPERDWQLLDMIHYDLNTCLREAVVLLKSFLHALPDAQLSEFEVHLRGRTSAERVVPAPRAHHLAHRRMAFLKGQ